MRNSVLLLHHAEILRRGQGTGPLASDAGVMEQVRAVETALRALNLPFQTAAISRLGELGSLLAARRPSVVFNLVEALEDDPEAACMVPAVCRAHGADFTGNDSPCLFVALDKRLGKAALGDAGLPTPGSCVILPGNGWGTTADLPPPPWIVKPACTDASEGIEPDSVIPAGQTDALRAAVDRLHRAWHQPALIEHYIDGREINVSVIASGGPPRVLPLAEIDFSAFPPDSPRIVDYAAKWVPDSFAYQHTNRLLPAELDDDTAALVRDLALRAWSAFGCRGYARVDMRLDAAGRPWILEINPNPDISPDAGFAAAWQASGRPYAELVAALLDGRVPAPRRGSGSPLEGCPGWTLRVTGAGDRQAILDALRASQVFRAHEIDVAADVLDTAIADGPEGHYQSCTALRDGIPGAWTCFGPAPCTSGTVDIYWIVVDPRFQREGVGAALMRHVERRAAAGGARLLVAETSSRPAYHRTHRFYGACGYEEQARVPDFYEPGDDKVIFVRRPEPAPPARRRTCDAPRGTHRPA